MKKQSGSAHVVIIVVLVIALVGAVGFAFWQNFLNKDLVSSTSNMTKSKSFQSTKPQNELIITQLGKSLPLNNTRYSDITYEMMSVNSDDNNKFIVAIYSKDLNNRLVAEAKQANEGPDYSTTYWKLSGNRAVYAYYYDAPSSTSEPAMIDGVASNIIDPTTKTASSSLYVGFMGPNAPNSESLNKENLAFLDWVKSNLK